MWQRGVAEPENIHMDMRKTKRNILGRYAIAVMLARSYTQPRQRLKGMLDKIQ